jgi:hypothetical protein
MGVSHGGRDAVREISWVLQISTSIVKNVMTTPRRVVESDIGGFSNENASAELGKSVIVRAPVTETWFCRSLNWHGISIEAETCDSFFRNFDFDVIDVIRTLTRMGDLKKIEA